MSRKKLSPRGMREQRRKGKGRPLPRKRSPRGAESQNSVGQSGLPGSPQPKELLLTRIGTEGRRSSHGARRDCPTRDVTSTGRTATHRTDWAAARAFSLLARLEPARRCGLDWNAERRRDRRVDAGPGPARSASPASRARPSAASAATRRRAGLRRRVRATPAAQPPRPGLRHRRPRLKRSPRVGRIRMRKPTCQPKPKPAPREPRCRTTHAGRAAETFVDLRQGGRSATPPSSMPADGRRSACVAAGSRGTAVVGLARSLAAEDETARPMRPKSNWTPELTAAVKRFQVRMDLRQTRPWSADATAERPRHAGETRLLAARTRARRGRGVESLRAPATWSSTFPRPPSMTWRTTAWCAATPPTSSM